MASFPTLNLRARLLLLVLLAVVPALGLMLYHARVQQRLTAALARDEVQRLAQLAEYDNRELVNETEQLLEVLGQFPQIQGTQSITCQALLANLIRHNPAYVNLGVAALDGSVFCSALPFSKPVNINDRAYFQRALRSREFAVGNYQVGRISGRPSINFGYPLLDTAGKVRAIVFAAVNLSRMNHFAATVQLPTGSTFTMVDSTGIVLVRYPDPQKWVGKSISDSLLMKAMRTLDGSGSMTATITGLDGVRRLFAVKHLYGVRNGDYGYVAIGIPTRVIFAKQDQVLRREMALMISIAVLVLLAGWLGSDWFILRPVGALLAAAKRLTTGDLEARAGPTLGRDEIGQLAQAFDAMADAMQRRVVEAEQRENRITRLNRIYAVLSGINAAIIRIQDGDELLKEICRVAVENGRFRLVWIGLLDAGTQVLRPVSHWGYETGYLQGFHVGLRGGGPESQGPTATALRESRHVVCNDVEHDPSMAYRRAEALERGYRSLAVFPLQAGARVVGSVNFLASEPHFFDAEEVNLLLEVAADIGFALDAIEKGKTLEYLANHDVLTGLPNRTLCNDRLDQALARAGHHNRFVAFAMLDLDRFKTINDNLGLHIGDRLLKEMAERLKRAVRDGDTVARLGSDEFGIVFSDLGRVDDGMLVVERLQRQLTQVVKLDAHEIFVTASIGVALFPNDGRSVNDLLQVANTALHAAKEAGGNTCRFYAPEISARTSERLKIETELHHALERNEFLLYYQPVVETKSGNIIGVEALLRWRNESLGFVPPSIFIPLAEETGLIVPIGAWVLKTACVQVLEWRKRGYDPIKAAVNVSAAQFAREDFVDSVGRVMREVGCDPGSVPLGIEITESELMENAESVVDAVRQLHAMGLSISIDDFGTGYSSLGYLKRFTVDTLKIDISFVKDLAVSPESVSIVKAMIAMAHTLGMIVVAEGVETDQQRSILRELGCDAIQGYLVSKPLPADEIQAMLSRGSSKG
ncbi:MAG: EAL domain-containing protein [Gammaproteobacteria bacterium]|nr:EAL domain-containing protein [Gammaproteobacteria bacterium]